MTQLYYARFSRPLINGVRRWVCKHRGKINIKLNGVAHTPTMIFMNVSKPVPLGFSKRPHKYMSRE